MRIDPPRGARAARARRHALVALALLASLAGCGGDASTAPATGSSSYGPHGGPIAIFPDDLGCAEVVAEMPPRAAPSHNARVVAYFLQADRKTPLASRPADVTVRLRMPDAPEPVRLELKPEPLAKDPVGTARLASTVGPYAVDRLIGEVSAVIDGTPVTGAFASER